MWNKPTQKQLSKIPALNETEHIDQKDKIIHMHLFIAGCDWYIAEFDGEDIFFGFAILNCDYENAEWGYSSLSELAEINIKGLQVDRDKHWGPTKVSEIDMIMRCLERVA